MDIKRLTLVFYLILMLIFLVASFDHKHYSAQKFTSCNLINIATQSLLDELYSKASQDADSLSMSIAGIDTTTNVVGNCPNEDTNVVVVVSLSVIYGSSTYSFSWIWYIIYAFIGISLMSCCILGLLGYRRRMQMQASNENESISQGQRLRP